MDDQQRQRSVRGILKLQATGRGRYYSRQRGLIESMLRLVYPYDWPARLWGLVPGATRVRLIEHRLPLLAGPEPLPPLRIAFVSDLHIGPTTPARTLDNAFSLLKGIAPDVLILGGDYVFMEATPKCAAELEARVAGVPAKLKLAVLGNHDLWTDHGLLEAALARAGVTVLVNQAVCLPAPHAGVAILGLDEPWTGQPDMEEALGGCEGASIKIAVCHSPDGVPHVRGRGVSLLMCGHTHGGQVALPGGRPLIVPGPHGKVWPWGLHQLEDMYLFVSRGVGGVEIPFRTFAPPDVALLTLVDPRAYEVGEDAPA